MWSALVGHVILTHLDMTPPYPGSPPPTRSLRRCFIRQCEGRLPSHMVSILTEGGALSSLWISGFLHSRFLQKSFRCSQHIFRNNRWFVFPVWLLCMTVQLMSRHVGLFYKFMFMHLENECEAFCPFAFLPLASIQTAPSHWGCQSDRINGTNGVWSHSYV